MIKHILHIKQHFFQIVLFGVAFALLGQMIPNCYYKYFDKTVYYNIENPVFVEQHEYRKCDDIISEFHRNSVADVQAIVVTELVRVSDNTEVEYYKRDVTLAKGELVLHSSYPIPCNAKADTYFFRGVVAYRVRGIEKTTTFYSDNFNIIN